MKHCSIEGCGKPLVAQGYCAAHRWKFKKYGDPLKVVQHQMHGATVKERLLAKCEKLENGCWEWTSSLGSKGYGQMHHRGAPRLAHRLSYEQFVGPILYPLDVLHRCDNPKCINPEHLFVGTHADNMADKSAKGRHHFGTSPGEAHGCAKLTNEIVYEIRRSAGPSNSVAKLYGISGRTVREIRARKTWKHLP